MADQTTISVYNQRAADYAEMMQKAEVDPVLAKFIAQLKPGDLVLDVGCGPGLMARQMMDAGLRVDAIDASTEMVRMAREDFGVNARLAQFGDIDGTNRYDGVWASFSLLHADPADFPDCLCAIHRALVPDGLFQIGMKTGTGCGRDRLGRFYAWYTQEELSDALKQAGFAIIDQTTGEDAGLSGEIAPWVSLAGRAIKPV